jgi:hypothetical protein
VPESGTVKLQVKFLGGYYEVIKPRKYVPRLLPRLSSVPSVPCISYIPGLSVDLRYIFLSQALSDLFCLKRLAVLWAFFYISMVSRGVWRAQITEVSL